MSGILYIVATPIGNLEDITLRALRVIREVDLLACEDTRQTSKLLNHYQIVKPMTSYHEHNELEKAEQLVRLLQMGKRIALLSDSGTPCISDPGYRIVRSALDRHIKVVPIPGPSAFVAALSASGRSTDSFIFLGFLPARKGPRLSLLGNMKRELRTLIFFEAPQRLLDTLLDLREILGERHVTVAREVTKMFEEFFSGTTGQAYDHFRAKSVRGEFVLILEKPTMDHVPLNELDSKELEKELHEIMQGENLGRNEALRVLAHRLHLSKRELYQLLVLKKNTS